MSSFIAPEDISQWRVLIVDDEPDNLTLASEFLTYSGATVAITERGEDLLAQVDEFLPTIILLDLAMPGMDGWEIQRRLRARTELSHIPIIALTALAMPEDVERAKMAGFDGYITKPFRVASLLRDIKTCVAAFVERLEAAARRTQEMQSVQDEQALQQREPDKREENTQPAEPVKESIHERTEKMENHPDGR
jgi:two-component system, cell cycle response regulator DivK